MGSMKHRARAAVTRHRRVCRLHNTDQKSNYAASEPDRRRVFTRATSRYVRQTRTLPSCGGRSAPRLFLGTAMFTPLECRLRSADCQRMMAHAPNPRLQAILLDISRTWTRLALEAEQTLKESRPPLQLIAPKSASRDLTPGNSEFA
jgi:hypothetical protein